MWLALARDHSIAATQAIVTNYRIHSQQISLERNGLDITITD